MQQTFRTQARRFIAVGTPLGEDVLLLQSFSYSEALGSLFELELDLILPLPPDGEKTVLEMRAADEFGNWNYFRQELESGP